MPLMSQQGNGHVFVSSTQPTAILTGDIWVDTSSSPNVIKTWNGSAWTSAINSTSNISIGGITDTMQNFIVEGL